MKNENFTYLKGLVLVMILAVWQGQGAFAQFGCDEGVVISDGYTEMGITTPGTGGIEDWNDNPASSSISTSYWDDDVYLFEYTAGGTAESIEMTIFTRNTYTGIGIFENCDGVSFSNELDAAAGSFSSDIELTASATIAANETVYIAVGQWGSPNDLDFDVIQFTAKSCLAPTDFVASNVTTTSADLDWTANGAESAWNVQYGAPGFDPNANEGTSVDAATNVGFTLSGLSVATEYEVYVQAECTEAIDLSTWVGPVSITTECAPFSPYYLEEFTDFVPVCWEEASNGNLQTGPEDFGFGSWTQDDYLNEGNSEAARINIYSSFKSDWLISPEIDLTSGGPFQLEFDFAITEFNDPQASSFGGDDSVSVVVSTDNFATWTEIQTWDVNYTSPEGGEHITLPLDAYAGEIVQIAFWGSEGEDNDDADVDVFVDNFRVRETPTCPEPLAITTGDLTANSAMLSWEAGDAETMWNLQYGAPGFDPSVEAGTIVAANTNTDFELTGLDAITDYEVYVQAVCTEDTDESIWFASTTFTTLATCPVPADISLDVATGSSATISWTSGSDETAWNVQYGAPGFDPEAGEGTTLEATSNNGFEITGLNELTEYEVYVQAECVTDTDLSLWAGPTSFTTLCAAFTPEYLEDFSDFLPDCWQEGEGGELTEGPLTLGSGGWTSDGFLNDGFSGAAKKNIYLAGDIDWLLSPEIDLAAATDYQIEFDLSIVAWGSDNPINLGSDDSLSVVISLDGGITWEELQTWESDYLMPEGGDYIIIPLTGYEGNIVRFAFRASEGEVSDPEDIDVHIDNFRVRETPNCPEPVALTVGTVEAQSAMISWDAGDAETQWNVQYGEAGFDPDADEGTTVVANTNTDFEINGLTAETDYEVYVQAACEPGITQSTWTGPAAFTTLPTCPQPVDLTVTSYSNELVTLSWTAGSDETMWNVQYGAPGFDPVAGEGTTVEATTNTDFEINGLSPETEYEFYVQAECVMDTDLSDWAGAASVNTDCDVFTPTYLEEFEGEFAPLCWAEAGSGDPSTGPMNIGGGDWTDDDFANDADLSTAAKLNLYSNTDQEWMISPLIDLTTGGPYQVDMDFAVTVWNSQNPGVLGSDDEVQLLVSADYGASWDTLAVFDSSYVSPQGGELIVRDLTDYSGEIVKLAIWGTDGEVSNENDNDIFVDNFRVREVPSCPEPFSLTSDNLEANSVELSWTAGGDEAAWNVIYGAPGFDPETEGTTLDAGNNNGFLLDGLDPETEYEVYVQAECVEDTDLSILTGPLSFTTPCLPVPITTLPWTEGFEGVTTPELPCGWITEDLNGDNITWISDDGEPNNGSNSLYMLYNSTEAMDDWVFTPEFVLEAGETYTLEFSYKTSSSYPENFEVFIGDDNTNGAMTQELAVFEDVANGEHETDLLTFTVPGDGSYYIGFHGYSEADQFYISIDDITVDVCSADASFAYSSDTLCTYNPSLTPGITGMTGGMFSAAAGLDIDPETGEIDPAASDVGSYEVTYEVTADSVCVDIQSTNIVIDPCTGVEEFDNLTSVSIYPNPASSEVNLDFAGVKEEVRMEVMDMTGKVVLSETFANPSQEEINVSGFESGIYMIRLSTDSNTVTKRVVVNK